MIRYTSSNTCTRILSNNRLLPKFRRILCGFCGSILSYHGEFRCRTARLLNFCNYTTYSIRFLIRWIVLVCILSLLRCKLHHRWDCSAIVHRSTNYILYLVEGRYYMGTNLNLTFFTCYKWNTGRSILSFRIRDRFGNRNRFVLREVGNIIWRGCFGLWRWVQNLRRWNKGISEMSLSFN